MDGIINEIVTDFTLGMGDDPRDPTKGLARVTTGFDIFTQRHRIVPAYASESGDNHADTSQKQAFGLGYWTPESEFRLFSLGVKSGASTAEILMKVITGTDVNGDLTNNVWQTPAVNQSASGITYFSLFVYYKTTGKFYGATSSGIWTFTPNGSTAFNDSEYVVSNTSVRQGVVHSVDDILYVPVDNKIYRNNAGTWSLALTCPSQFTVTSICEFGNYLAIALAPKSNGGNSRVFLWDRDTSLATISETIDFGPGYIQVLEELDGYLVGILNLSNINSNPFLRPRVVFRYCNGGTVVKTFKTIYCGSGDGIGYQKQKINERVYFTMYVTIDGVMRNGLWSVGISSTGQFTIAHERKISNDDPVSNNAPQGFFIVGDYAFISYYASGSFALSKTNDSGTAFSTARYETNIKNAGNSDIIKKLIGCALMFEPLSASASVSMFAKKDAETSWTRLFKFSSESEISHGAVNVEPGLDTVTMTIASPAVVSLTDHGLIAGQKIRFKTTGALPTGVIAGKVYYVISSGLTADAFKFSATIGGAAVNTSGSQSGTHTLDRTANLPEGKEIMLAFESKGGAVITGYRYAMEGVPKQLF